MVLVVGMLLATAFLQIVKVGASRPKDPKVFLPLNPMFIPTTLELPVQDGRHGSSARPPR